jgi:hypothetical protein
MLMRRIMTPRTISIFGKYQEPMIEWTHDSRITIDYMFFQEGPSPDSGGTQFIVW